MIDKTKTKQLNFKETSENVTFMFNVAMHCYILFVVLSILFIFVISKVEVNAFQGEINNLANSSVNNALNNLDPNNSLMTKQYINNNKTSLEYLQTIYAKPDPTKVLNNSWLFNMIWIMIVLFFCLLLFTFLLLRYAANKRLPITTLIRENVAVFSLVLIVEGLFFWFVARKFIPTKPSLTTYDAYTRIEQNLIKK